MSPFITSSGSSGGSAIDARTSAERARRAERLRLAHVVDVHAELRAVAEVRLDQLRAVADGDDEVVARRTPSAAR